MESQKIVTVRSTLTEGEVKRLKNIAEEQRRSLAALIRSTLRYHVLGWSGTGEKPLDEI